MIQVCSRAAKDAFTAYLTKYSKWDIPHQLRIYDAAERAFGNAPDYEAFKSVYDWLKNNWQALRPFRPGTWSASETFAVLSSLPTEVRKNSLSGMHDTQWNDVWKCICAMQKIKPNKNGPSIVAISKFLHFWNPKVFIIADVAYMQNWVFAHSWLKKEMTKVETSILGSEPDNLCWYYKVLRFGSAFIKANPHICRAFAETVKGRAETALVPPGLHEYEATATEWCLLGLAELPPAGINIVLTD